MKKYAIICTFLCVAALACAGVQDLRVYRIRDAVFEYKFITAVSAEGESPVFTLRHLNGRSHFVRLGDSLGPYKVKTYRPDTKKVYRESTRSFHTVGAGVLTLEDTDGSLIPLQLNRAMDEDGRMACVMSLTSGSKQYARKSDRLTMDGRRLRIMKIDDDSIQIFTAGAAYNIPMISTDESVAMAIMRNETRRRKAEALRTARTEAESRRWERQSEAAARRTAAAESARSRTRSVSTVEIRGTPRFAYGYTYPMPLHYHSVPVWSRTHDGRQCVRPVTVPEKFETRREGITLSTSGFQLVYRR